MQAEQDECKAIERRADDIARFLAEGKVKQTPWTQVANLARHMAGRLPALTWSSGSS